jgi:hypothetical protein
VTEVTWLRHKGGVKYLLAHFGVLRVKGVRGTHNRNREVTKFENTLSSKGFGHASWSRGVEVCA